jgi:uncharacterized protein YhjY with autotransporter beta-barrel domain
LASVALLLALSLFVPSRVAAQAAGGAAMSLTISGSGQLVLGDQLTFTSKATNTGSVTLTSVVVTDSFNTVGTSCPSVPQGGSCILITVHIVTSGDVTAGKVLDTATASSAQTPTQTTGGGGSITPPVLPGIAGLTPSEAEVGNAFDRGCRSLARLPTLTPAQQDFLAQCRALASAVAQNPGQVSNGLNWVLPHDALIQTNASILVNEGQFDNIDSRLAALRSGAGSDHFGGLAFSSPDGVLPIGKLGETALGLDGQTAAKPSEVGSGFDRWGFFLTGTFGDGTSAPRQTTQGYDFRSSGITAGVDYRLGDSLIYGMSAGYSSYSSDVDDVGGGLDTHGFSLSAYMSFFRKDNWYLDDVLTWGNIDYDMVRRIDYPLTTSTGNYVVNQAATSRSNGTSLASAITLGRDFSNGPWSFGPYLRATASTTNYGGYQETMISNLPGSGLGLDVQRRTMKDLSSVLGAKFNFVSSQSWGVLIPHAEIEWQHEFNDNPDNVNAQFLQDPTGTAIQLPGNSIDTNFYRIGLGLSCQLPQGRSGFIYYQRTLGLPGVTQNDISLGFRMEF